jgi:hypothetical protein
MACKPIYIYVCLACMVVHELQNGSMGRWHAHSQSPLHICIAAVSHPLGA